MAKRVPMNGTVVVRDGKRVRPVIGQPFSYTADEIKDLEAAGAKLLKPAEAAEEEAEDATATASSAEKSQSAARGGKKEATANKSDAEKSDDDL